MTLAIKEMIYTNKWLHAGEEILAKDSYKGYEYMVVSYGVHPCAYIALTEKQPYYRVADYDDVRINCHGGCTFVEWGYKGAYDQTYKVIGWDYGHYNDFSGSYLGTGHPLSVPKGKKWTTKEMIQDCKNVIEQLYILEHSELYYK